MTAPVPNRVDDNLYKFLSRLNGSCRDDRRGNAPALRLLPVLVKDVGELRGGAPIDQVGSRHAYYCPNRQQKKGE